jgi:hypothetical protein
MTDDERADETSRAPTGSLRTGLGRTRHLRTGVAALLVLATIFVALVVATAGPSTAATLDGVATTANPNGLSFVASGGSDTPFVLNLGNDPVCSGDSATDGYRVWSYLVQPSVDIDSLTFNGVNNSSQGYGLYQTSGTYFGPANTAQTTGEVLANQTQVFEWGPGVSARGIQSDLLYSGTSGVWEGGLACANSSGVLTDNWNSQFTFTASDTDPNGFTWSAVPGPEGDSFAAVTSADSATFTEGSTSSFTPTGSGTPTPAITESGALPGGVTFSGGVLSGNPTATGTFPITFTATNGIGNPAVQDFTLTVNSVPAFTSADDATFSVNGPGTFTVAASGFPTPSFTEANSLDGLTFNDNGDGTATLSGTATATGAFPITFDAANSAGTTPQSFTLTVTEAPAFTSGTSVTFTQNQSNTFTVSANGVPTPSFTEANSLDGLNFEDNGDGTATLSGNPTATGTFPITFYAANSAGTTPQSFTLTVIGPPSAPTIGTATAGNGDATVSFTAPASDGGSSILGYTVTATDTTYAFNGGQTQTGGPNSTSITVSGLTNGDTYTFTVAANNSVGTGPGSGTSNSATPTTLIPVAITSADATAVAAGGKVAFTVTATGSPAPTITNPGGGLPLWLTFKGGKVGKDASLKGKAPATSGGAYQFTLEAANGVAPPVYETFTVDVLQITSGATASATAGEPFTFDVTTSNAPANPTLTVTGLPAGLTFTPAATGGTGTITGAATHAKSYKVKVTATSGSVVAKQTLVITVQS